MVFHIAMGVRRADKASAAARVSPWKSWQLDGSCDGKQQVCRVWATGGGKPQRTSDWCVTVDVMWLAACESAFRCDGRGQWRRTAMMCEVAVWLARYKCRAKQIASVRLCLRVLSGIANQEITFEALRVSTSATFAQWPKSNNRVFLIWS